MEKETFFKQLFPEKVYQVYQVANILHKARNTICEWLKRYGIETFKMNGSRFVTRESLIEMLTKGNSRAIKIMEEKEKKRESTRN